MAFHTVAQQPIFASHVISLMGPIIRLVKLGTGRCGGRGDSGRRAGEAAARPESRGGGQDFDRADFGVLDALAKGQRDAAAGAQNLHTDHEPYNKIELNSRFI